MNKITKIAQALNSRSKILSINKRELEKILDIMFHEILFPICTEGCTTGKDLFKVYSVLLGNISSIVGLEKAEKMIDEFFQKLPDLQKKLYAEAENYIKNDPAANTVEEVILAYPGFFAMAVYRIANVLHKIGVPIIPRIFSEYAHSSVGIDIHPGAEIGDMFFIDHGTGIVIGETTIIGENVKIYQGVTLGALFVTKSLKNTKRHPTIEDNVVIYSGATILGGETVIGHDSTIGGNVWLTKGVEPHSVVYHKAEVRIKNTQDDGVLDFSI